jgi:hypothetical protein
MGENWTLRSIAGPLSPVLTYRARMLLPGKEGTPEGEFWWRVFELEWTVLVFGRWCADIAEREIQWRLPPRARAGVTELGLENGFRPFRSGYANMTPINGDFDSSRTGFEGREVI